MAKKTVPKKKKAAKAPVRRAAGRKAAATRTVRKATANAAGRQAAATRKAKKAVKKAVKRSAAVKAAPKRQIAAVRAAAKRSAKATAKKSGATLRATKAAATRALNELRKKATQRIAGYKAGASKLKRKAPKAAPARAAAPARTVVKTAPKKAAARPVRKPPALDRERRTVAEREMVPMPPSSLVPGHASAARSGADELRVKLATHTGSGPVLTAGDVDADWGAAEAVGDEAPGGDNPTPDQDVVDEIGRALGVEYDDDEELQGGDEIAGRDRDRWELDPASSDDFDER